MCKEDTVSLLTSTANNSLPSGLSLQRMYLNYSTPTGVMSTTKTQFLELVSTEMRLKKKAQSTMVSIDAGVHANNLSCGITLQSMFLQLHISSVC